MAAFVLAYSEYRRQNRLRIDDRVNEIAAVGLTYEVERPRRFVDGSGRYRYDFTIHNPGRLPISEVKVDLKFPLRVHRTHADGSVGTYLGSDELRMEVAAVAAGGNYTWDRHLLVPESIGKKMRQTTASILFYSTDAGWCRTTWPCPAGSKSDRLIARLPKDLRVSDIDSLDNP